MKTAEQFLEELKKDINRELQYNLCQNKQACEYLGRVVTKIEQFEVEQKQPKDGSKEL
jgi:hypothetical protein